MTRENMINGVKTKATLRWVKADGELPRLIRFEKDRYESCDLILLEESGRYSIGYYTIILNEDGSVKEFGLEGATWKGLRKSTDVVAWAELPLVPGIND